jgi:hypothetical protein
VQARGGEFTLKSLERARHPRATLDRTGDTAAAVETQRRVLSLMPEAADTGVATRLAEYEAALKVL